MPAASQPASQRERNRDDAPRQDRGDRQDRQDRGDRSRHAPRNTSAPSRGEGAPAAERSFNAPRNAGARRPAPPRDRAPAAPLSTDQGAPAVASGEQGAPEAPRHAPRNAQRSGPARAGARSAAPRAPVRTHPVLEKLAQLYPQHFGAVFLPLKRGIFQDIMAAHPEAFDKAELKVALSIHTRSSRYLQAVASGAARHDLSVQPVEAVAPEHVHHAVLEIFRRRQARGQEDLSPQLRQRIGRVFEASGWTQEQYSERVRSRLEATNTLVAAALQEAADSLAQAQALHDAFVASGTGVAEFAAAQQMDPRAVGQALERIGRHVAAVQAAQERAQATAAALASDAALEDDLDAASEAEAEAEAMPEPQAQSQAPLPAAVSQETVASDDAAQELVVSPTTALVEENTPAASPQA